MSTYKAIGTRSRFPGKYVIIAALVLILMPEYLRAFAEYRMLMFGAVMVLMMIFRPEGLIANVRRKYTGRKVTTEGANA